MADQKSKRCPWPGIEDEEYTLYHDTEWGVPMTDDQKLFEKLVLEGFQAGLSWLTILRKRKNFRKAFHNFDAKRIAGYGTQDITRLMADTGIVRNKLKIEATIANAKALLILQSEISLTEFLWCFSDDFPATNQFSNFSDVPAETATSKALAKELKTRGFRFVGPTTMYAFMQSVGLVNDHLTTCPRHKPCAQAQKRLSGILRKKATTKKSKRT